MEIPQRGNFPFPIENFEEKIEKVMGEMGSFVVPPHSSLHSFSDMFLLAEKMTNIALNSFFTSLFLIGLTSDELSKIKNWSKNHSVSIRFKKRSETTEINTKRAHEFLLFKGPSPSPSSIILHQQEICWDTLGKEKVTEPEPIDLNITWALQNLKEINNKGEKEKEKKEEEEKANAGVQREQNTESTVMTGFHIDRSQETCRTPRRNEDLSMAILFFSSLREWGQEVYQSMSFERKREFWAHPTLQLHKKDLFCPIFPVFQIVSSPSLSSSPLSSSLSLPSPNVFETWKKEETSSLLTLFTNLNQHFSSRRPSSKMHSKQELRIQVLLNYFQKVSKTLLQSFDYLESVLSSLVQGMVGKIVNGSDFNDYMDFHHRKLFLKKYQPKPFRYFIRQDKLNPQGCIGIENINGDPVYTIVRKYEQAGVMHFPLNAATNVKFGGKRYVHGLMRYSFASPSPEASLFLSASTRNFSSYIVLIGKVWSAKLFSPEVAFFVQNKEEFQIPLNLSTIPTAKEFEDATASLSQNQKKFAQEIRKMQLASTLFGVCVIEVTPQLEALLCLPPFSLSKEVDLVEEILDLFLTYQIPSDLLSFSGNPNETTQMKVESVRRSVEGISELIQEMAEEEGNTGEQRLDMGVLLALIENERKVTNMKEYLTHEESEGVVVDLGSMFIKAGFQGEIYPERNIRSVIGRPRHRGVMVGMQQKDSYCGGEEEDPSQNNNENNEEDGGEENQEEEGGEREGVKEKRGEEGDLIDFSVIPGKLDQILREKDPYGKARASIFSLGSEWKKTKKNNKGVVPYPQSSQIDEKNRSFDLLDALSKGGEIEINAASLHIITAYTHCYDESLWDCLIEKNVNPIEKVERGTLLISSILFNQPISHLIPEEEKRRVTRHSPKLFDK